MPADDTPLMPKATAVWLVDNTSLSFDQIAAFCRLHPLEVGAIADGDAAQGIKGTDPIQTGQLTREEIKRGEDDPAYRLKLSRPKTVVPELKRKAPRYTPVSKRQDRPNAILWLLRHHPELKEAAIIRLVGTTKTTIHAIRDRTHWNSANLQPLDPVTLGLCTQMALDREVEVAAREAGITQPPAVPVEQPDVLMPVEESLSEAAPEF
ncbi:MAG: cell cycle transcriptional regulator TrcR, partial [Pseudomonadota bacterium]